MLEGEYYESAVEAKGILRYYLIVELPLTTIKRLYIYVPAVGRGR